MTEFRKILESTVKVRFHDCDPHNHLNNSRYIDYIVTARGDQLLDNYGLDIYELLRRDGLGWVTVQTQISYYAPATLMEEVIIETQLLECNAKSLHLEGIMWNKAKTQIKALMWAKLVHFNTHMQSSQPHSAALMALFQQVVNRRPAPCSFEERIQSLKQQV